MDQFWKKHESFPPIGVFFESGAKKRGEILSGIVLKITDELNAAQRFFIPRYEEVLNADSTSIADTEETFKRADKILIEICENSESLLRKYSVPVALWCANKEPERLRDGFFQQLFFRHFNERYPELQFEYDSLYGEFDKEKKELRPETGHWEAFFKNAFKSAKIIAYERNFSYFTDEIKRRFTSYRSPFDEWASDGRVFAAVLFHTKDIMPYWARIGSAFRDMELHWGTGAEIANAMLDELLTFEDNIFIGTYGNITQLINKDGTIFGGQNYLSIIGRRYSDMLKREDYTSLDEIKWIGTLDMVLLSLLFAATRSKCDCFVSDQLIVHANELSYRGVKGAANFKEDLDVCESEGIEKIVIYLKLMTPAGAHASLLIIDRTREKWMLFNPWGQEGHAKTYYLHSDMIKNWLLAQFGEKYVRDQISEFCPAVQGSQTAEKKTRHGWCALWTAWWMDTILTSHGAARLPNSAQWGSLLLKYYSKLMVFSRNTLDSMQPAVDEDIITRFGWDTFDVFSEEQRGVIREQIRNIMRESRTKCRNAPESYRPRLWPSKISAQKDEDEHE